MIVYIYVGLYLSRSACAYIAALRVCDCRQIPLDCTVIRGWTASYGQQEIEDYSLALRQTALVALQQYVGHMYQPSSLAHRSIGSGLTPFAACGGVPTAVSALFIHAELL